MFCFGLRDRASEPSNLGFVFSRDRLWIMQAVLRDAAVVPGWPK